MKPIWKSINFVFVKQRMTAFRMTKYF